MRLLVAVINDPERLDEALSGFVELGITGATIIDSEGMGQMLSHDIPIFAGLQTLISGSRPRNRVVLSVMPKENVAGAIQLLHEVCGELERPATGIVFTLPVEDVVGLAPELGDERSPI